MGLRCPGTGRLRKPMRIMTLRTFLSHVCMHHERRRRYQEHVEAAFPCCKSTATDVAALVRTEPIVIMGSFSLERCAVPMFPGAVLHRAIMACSWGSKESPSTKHHRSARML